MAIWFKDGRNRDAKSSGTNFWPVGTSADGFVPLIYAANNPWKPGSSASAACKMEIVKKTDGAGMPVICGMEFDGMGESTADGGPEDGFPAGWAQSPSITSSATTNRRTCE